MMTGTLTGFTKGREKRIKHPTEIPKLPPRLIVNYNASRRSAINAHDLIPRRVTAA
jgi:hypothetical protein